MAWRRSGDKPLSEPMLVSLPTHICVTWPQWVNCRLQNALTRYCVIKLVNIHWLLIRGLDMLCWIISMSTGSLYNIPEQYTGLDSFTVSLHSHNVRDVQVDCQWPSRRWKFPPVTRVHNALPHKQSCPIFRATNHKTVMPANWRPCLIRVICHWQS